MLRGKDTVRETYYDILSVKEDASYEEIRTGYRAAILSFHPDKMKVPNEASRLGVGLGERFLNIQKAWEILGNSSSRAVYDMQLRASRQDAEVAEDINLDDVTIEDNGEVLELFYQCRCGDYFSVDSLELGKMGYNLSRDESQICLKTADASTASVVLPCGSCSLQIRLLLSTDNKHLS